MCVSMYALLQQLHQLHIAIYRLFTFCYSLLAIQICIITGYQIWCSSLVINFVILHWTSKSVDSHEFILYCFTDHPNLLNDRLFKLSIPHRFSKFLIPHQPSKFVNHHKLVTLHWPFKPVDHHRIFKFVIPHLHIIQVLFLSYWSC